MRVRILSTILFLVIVISTAKAQEIWQAVGEPIALTPQNKQFLQPIFSPDGTRIALAGENYSSLWVLDVDGQNLQQLSDEIGAGYRFEWSLDSKEILARVSKYRGRRRSHVIKAFNVENLKSRVIRQFPSTVYSLPKWSVDNQKIFIFTKNGVESFPSNKIASIQQSGVRKRQIDFYIYKDVFYVIDSNGEEVNRFKPVPGNYLNAVLSPDGQKIAFQVIGGPMFVINMDGTGLVDLGPGERPRWSPDSEWLVYMIPTDDGHQFLASDIYVIRANGTEITNLTKTENQLEMNPDWSPDGQFIVFDEKKSGRIYMLRLEKQ